MHKKKLKIKICGMMDLQNIKEIARLQPDFMGFIFYGGSPRFYQRENLHLQDDRIKRIGVFVNAPFESIRNTFHQFGLHYVQLHGQESPKMCGRLKESGIPVIKAFSIRENFTWKKVKAYDSNCDLFLFDTPGKMPGGNGHPFDWKLLDEYVEEIPFFLSGGIGIHNVGRIVKLDHPSLMGIDINSRVELSPGIKQVAAVKKVMMTITEHNFKSEE